MRIVWLSQVSVPTTMSGFSIFRRAWNWGIAEALEIQIDDFQWITPATLFA